MSKLSLSLLGSFNLFLDGQDVSGLPTKKVQALLVYLVAEPDPQRRDFLTNLLWPGMPDRSARSNLRQSLYFLRKAIPETGIKEGVDEDDGPSTVPLLLANRLTIQLNPAADAWLDGSQYEALLAENQAHDHLELLLCPDCRTRLEQAVALYRGDFLADFFLDDSDEFENWAEARRATFRRQALDALETLTGMHIHQKAYPEARAYAQRQIEIDNLHEGAYRQLMKILALNGQRSEALALFDECKRILAEELGMAPSAPTSQVYEQILAGDLSFETAPAQGVRGYELKDEIGEGAYGAIHRAIQPAIGREVAVKVIRRKYANDPEFIRRFEVEAQTVAHLEHPHIVPLYDYWRDPDGAYLVMRYLRGGSLLSALESGPWDAEPTMKMIDQVTAALTVAHQQGVIHRDIKPANILLDEAGNAYLSDFGIAKNLARETQLTTGGAVLGTPDYISPEQIKSEPIGPQSDVYSLGAVLYETLTGERPYPDASLAELIHKHLTEPVPLVSESRPDLPLSVDDVIQRATAKEPADRYASALELASAFRQALGGREVETPPSLPVPEVAEVYNPYKGLRAFQEADADDFFGRDTLIDSLVGRLAESRFVAVVGPSGSGKSSAVKAGVIPALRKSAIPGSDKWFVAEMAPGSHPLEELDLALWPVAVDPPPSLVEPMERDVRGMLRTIRRILPDEDGAELLLVIDQFEELFTLVDDEERREFFLESLLAAISAVRSPIRVVITLRADFYDRPLQHPVLGQLLKEHTEIILPLNHTELTWAVREPARRVGVSLEEGLAEAIVGDVAEQPGALPLLQYAMTELFDQRQNGLMSRNAYSEIGGVLGALGRRADEIYLGFSPKQQETTRQLFLRLVTLGEGVEDTRRRVLRSELEALETSEVSETSEVFDVVVAAFGAARLLTFDHDPVTREPTVEVAHEALLREWIRLRGWLDESRNDVRMQRMLAQAAWEWEASGQDTGFLLREARLDQFAGWAAGSTVALTGNEQAFLETSVEAREARLAEEEARRRRELETAQKLAETERERAEEQAQAAGRLRRRAYILGGVLVAAALLAIVAIFFANQANQNAESAAAEANQRATAQAFAEEQQAAAEEQRGIAVVEAESRATAQAQAEANEVLAIAQQATAQAEADFRATAEAVANVERQNAEEQAMISFSRELAAASLNNIETDPELSILLALEGLDSSHTIEAESALHQAIVASSVRQSFVNDARQPWLALSPDGRIVYVSGDSGGEAWDTVTGDLLYSHPVPAGDWINRSDFSPDGSLLVLPYESYNDAGEGLPGRVWLADAQTGQILVDFEAHEAWMQSAKFSPDGSLFATASADQTLKVWDLDATLEEGTGQLVATYCCMDTWNNGLDFSPDGEHIAIVLDNDLVIWDFAADETLFTLEPNTNFNADYSPDGRYLVTAGKAGKIEVWDTTTGERLSTTVAHAGGPVSDAEFSHDGTQIASTGSNGSITLWRFSPDGLEEIRDLPRQAGLIGGVAFSPDDQVLFTQDPNTTRAWDISPAGSAEIAALKAHGDTRISDFQLLGDGSQLLTVGYDGMLRLWDTQSWEEVRSIQAHEGRIFEVAVSPDGQMVATTSPDDVLPKVWDANTWQLLFTLEGHEMAEPAISWSPGVFAVQFSPDGSRLATGGADGTTRIWDTSNGNLLDTLIATSHSDPVNIDQTIRLNYSLDGKLLATAGQDQAVRVWDANEGQVLLALIGDPPEDSHWSLAFSPDGSRLATGGRGQAIEMWQLPANPWQSSDEDISLLYQLPSDAGWIEGINFSPDGERIVATGQSGLVEIRGVDTGELLLGLQHPAGVSKAEFSSDGKRLMTAGHDGIFRIWSLDLEELTALAQTRVTRELTEAECQQYLHLDACPQE